MDILSNLKPAKGSTKKTKRIGRGQGSGHGGTSTRGMNGQLSRSGAKKRKWFEGGQMPLQRRIPKRGFTNIFRIEFSPVNVELLQELYDKGHFKDGNVNPVALYNAGVISRANTPYKILGTGEIKAKLNIETYTCSVTAKEKIEVAGGIIKLING
ncbi:MAG: 50S ribosomal protein L15 [Ignavibacteria bacterium]